jgi:hypothetical protein
MFKLEKRNRRKKPAYKTAYVNIVKIPKML